MRLGRRLSCRALEWSRTASGLRCVCVRRPLKCRRVKAAPRARSALTFVVMVDVVAVGVGARVVGGGVCLVQV